MHKNVRYDLEGKNALRMVPRGGIIVLEKHREKAEQIMMNYKLDRKL